MNTLIVIKNGNLINQTVATVKFDSHGSPTNINFIICEFWEEGFVKAKSSLSEFALFVNAGTVFSDIKMFVDQLAQYPHKGLVGHIIDPKDPTRFFNLDDQCFFLKLDLFQSDQFSLEPFRAVWPQRSDTNLHDDYTPLWLKPGLGEEQSWPGTAFGERLLASQLTRDIAVNWNNSFRDNKKFLYNESAKHQWTLEQKEYTDLAENQLWVFNNEPIPLANKDVLVTPASGLCWIKNLIAGSTIMVNLVDISKPQLALAKKLWTEWDGTNYGEFVFNFVKQNNIIHVNLDQPSMSALDRIKLKSSKFFVDTVNAIFEKQTADIDDFSAQWTKIKNTKQVTFTHADMVNFLPEYVKMSPTKFNLWGSNILDYKYTLIKNNSADYIEFTLALDNTKVIQIYG
jgi:hypothetical protein